MLASEFVKAVQEAGLPFEKVSTVDVNTKVRCRSIKVHVGSVVHEVDLSAIHNLDRGELNRTLKKFRETLDLESDFDALPEKG